MNLLKHALASVVLMPLMVFADTWTDSHGITWTYSVSDGTARIGTGSHYSAIPTSTSGAITIPSTLGSCPVTSIGDNAFYGCSGLMSITIPSGVTSIGEWAFRDCSGLNSVSIPESVISIGDAAFSGCSGLTSVIMPASVKSLGKAPFSGSGLVSVGLPEGTTEIFAYEFSGCANLASVTMPSTVTSIGGYAFENCAALKALIVPNSVESMGRSALAGCASLESLTVPFVGTRRANEADGALAACWFEMSGSFDGGYEVWQSYEYSTSPVVHRMHACVPVSLKSLTITDETIVGFNALAGFSSLTNVSLNAGLKTIGGEAFRGCSGLVSMTIPDGLESVGNKAFSDCMGLMTVPLVPASVTSMGSYVFSGCVGLVNVVIPEGTPVIGDNEFSGCANLASVTIPSTVTSIGGYAFENCAALKALIVPDSVQTLGEGVFAGCASLESLTVPFVGAGRGGEPQTPGSMATYWFGEWNLDGFYEVWYDYHYQGGGSMHKGVVYVPESLTSVVLTDEIMIGSQAFVGFCSLTNVMLNAGVKTIGSEAFRGCSGLVSITLPGGLESIGDRAFGECSSLEAIHIARDGDIETVKQMLSDSGFDVGSVTFDYVGESDEVDDGVYVVSKDGYDWTVTVEYGEVWIGDRTAWSYSEAAISPQPSGALEIPEEFFGLPVVGLSTCAFMYCTEMTSVRIPKDMWSVSPWAFVGCAALASISVDDENESLKSEGGFLLGVEWDGRTSLVLAVGKTGPCAVPDGVVTVYPEAFSLCPEMTALSLPESVADFEANAVDDCAALLSITVAEDNPNFKSVNGFLLSKDGTALVACPGGIADVVVPNGVTAVGVEDYFGGLQSPFPGGSKMRSIAIPASVEQIADGAFSACESLTEITVDSGNAVYTAANGLLMTADGRTLLACAGGCIDVVIPDGVTEIGGSVFAGSFSLHSVTAPASVQSIGAGAFSSCYFLTAVCFAGDAPEVEETEPDDWFARGLYEGADYVTTYVQLGSQGWGKVPGTWHERPIKWWTTDNPSPIPELEDDADVNQVYMALHGSKDDKLVDNILMTCLTEGDVAGADLYNNYRLWAGRVQDGNGDPLGLQAVRNSATAWASFALDQATLLERNLTDEDLKIEEFKPSMEAGTFDFTVSIKDVEVGPLAMAENLKKTFGLEGAAELVPSAFDEANVDIEFGMPTDGKLKFTAEPLDKDAKSFFMKMKVR